MTSKAYYSKRWSAVDEMSYRADLRLRLAVLGFIVGFTAVMIGFGFYDGGWF